GFLWIATWDGLARWDGERITSYGTPDGLPSTYVEALSEAPDGTLWLDTFALPAQPGKPRVSCVFADSRGRLWCGSSEGLCCARDAGAATPRFELVRPGALVDWPGLACEDSAGRLWFGAGTDVLEYDGTRFLAHPLPEP